MPSATTAGVWGGTLVGDALKTIGRIERGS
jgi:hypothetical protein